MKNSNIVIIISILAVVMPCAAFPAKKAAPCGKPLITFQPGQKWEAEKTVKSSMPDSYTGKTAKEEYTALEKFSVVKVFTDGSALVEMTTDRLPYDLIYYLMQPGGLVYQPVPKPRPASKDEELMMAAIPDEVGDLKKTENALEWCSGRQSMDALKLPDKCLKDGKKTKKQVEGREWEITRNPDEKAGGADCEVYAACLKDGITGIDETVWFNRAGGFVAKRVIKKSGGCSYEEVWSRR